MLKITIHRDGQSARLVLEGALFGPWLAELRLAWQALAKQAVGRPVVDLTGVSHVSRDGKALLQALWQEGARLHASGCFTKSLVEDITNRTGRDPRA